ncbi:MAG: hypothetical protein QXN24_01310 [Candidatus Bathyarchaeia archaeon]
MPVRFCLECKNFEDRMEIDGSVVCAKNHKPGVSCPDFQDRVIDIFHNYIYWSYLYSSGRTEEGKEFLRENSLKNHGARPCLHNFGRIL